jgi:hypothetical protein
LIVLGLVGLFLAWLFFGGRSDAPEPTAHRRVNESIDVSALEQAEREARAADADRAASEFDPPRRPPLI